MHKPMSVVHPQKKKGNAPWCATNKLQPVLITETKSMHEQDKKNMLAWGNEVRCGVPGWPQLHTLRCRQH